MSTVEQCVGDIEEQLLATRDAAERHRLLQMLRKALVGFQDEVEFSDLMGGRIEINDERYKRQKEVVAHLKYDEAKTADAYFLAITIKTILALYGYHRAVARKILVCIVPRPN